MNTLKGPGQCLILGQLLPQAATLPSPPTMYSLLFNI